MRKQNSKNNLDEMQEQTLLKIESRGMWIAFYGLVLSLLVHVLIGGEQVGRSNPRRKHTAADFIAVHRYFLPAARHLGQKTAPDAENQLDSVRCGRCSRRHRGQRAFVFELSRGNRVCRRFPVLCGNDLCVVLYRNDRLRKAV